MLVIKKVRHGINIYEVWKAKEPYKRSGIVQYHQAYFQDEAGEMTEFRTLLTDLTLSPEEIRLKFDRTCRNKINRGFRENIVTDVCGPGEINKQAVEEFLDFFRKFWESKDLDYFHEESLRASLDNYISSNALYMTRAYIDGTPVVYHTYIADEESARLLHSASLFRLGEGINPVLLGVANRLLHYKDMLFFKETGRTTYDWGGAGQDAQVADITRFKASFGGEPRIFYDGERAYGIGKIYRLLTGLKR